MSEYVGSAPPKDSGLHRYVFLSYKQPEKLKFDEPYRSNTNGNRSMFSTERFVTKYNLGKPVAGNFFQAEYDDYVPIAHKKLGFWIIWSNSANQKFYEKSLMLTK